MEPWSSLLPEVKVFHKKYKYQNKQENCTWLPFFQYHFNIKLVDRYKDSKNPIQWLIITKNEPTQFARDLFQHKEPLIICERPESTGSVLSQPPKKVLGNHRGKRGSRGYKCVYLFYPRTRLWGKGEKVLGNNWDTGMKTDLFEDWWICL